MDAIDRTIIGTLQTDGRISVTDLADAVSLSLSATSERLKRLRDSGVISGFTVVVNPVQAGRPIEALIDVRLGDSLSIEDLDTELARLSAVMNAMHLTGRFDVQLHVAAKDVPELDRLLETLKSELGVEETNTRLVLRTIGGFPRPAQIS